MDLSVFNLLMSTNPNTSTAENLFPNAAQSGISAPADSAKESLRTGEAFLQVLDQVRTGKAEKNANVLYNTLSARADAASSLKDLRKSDTSRENVKVVKLHIKRTRASEKLRKADEEKTALPSNPAQNGQKIPTRENIAAVQETSPVQPKQTTDAQDVEYFIQSGDFCVSEKPVEQSETPFISTEEITAADILINSAVQATLAPLTRTPQPIVEEQTPETQSLSVAFLPQKEIIPADHQQASAPKQTPEKQPETQRETQNDPTFIPIKKLVQKHDEFAFAPDQEKIASVPNKRSQEDITTAETKLPEKIQTVLPIKQEAHETVKAAQIQIKETPKTTAVSRSASVDTPNVQEIQSLKTDYSSHPARRQAELLAREIPAQTNIAITVETQTPVVQDAVQPHTVSKRFSLTEKTKGTDTETTEPVTEEKEVQKASSPAKELTLHSVKTEHLRPSAEQTKQAEILNGLVALPVQNKSLPAASATPQAEGQVAEIGTPSVSGTPIPALSIGHELKGKAVSGTVPVQKNVPTNELVDQIKVNIKKALKDGLDKIDIVLKPKELGTIKIHLEIGKDGTMKAVLNTARAETLDLLQSDLTVLKQALADSGFDLNDQAFSFNYRGERYNDEQKQPQNRPTVSSAEADDETAEESAGTLSISGRYALNIKV